MAKHKKLDSMGYATQKTRTGTVDMKNKKPFRSAKLKEIAKQNAKKVDGTWVSNTPVQYH